MSTAAPHTDAVDPALAQAISLARKAALVGVMQVFDDLDALLGADAARRHLALSGAFSALAWASLARLAADEDAFVAHMREPPMTEARTREVYRIAHQLRE